MMATAATTARTTIRPVAIGLRHLAARPRISAATAMVANIPAPRASLSLVPKVVMAQCLSHSGVRVMKVLASDCTGEEAADSTLVQTPSAASNSAAANAVATASNPAIGAHHLDTVHRAGTLPGTGRSMTLDPLMLAVRHRACSGWVREAAPAAPTPV